MKGYFKPKNFQKYVGDPTNIVYRSSWELKKMNEYDKDKNIISWGSECVVIPYVSPIDQKVHRYYVDFIIVEMINNKKQTKLIEVKPLKQTKHPPKRKKVTKGYITEVVAYNVNIAKWKAAMEYCKDRGWKFEILTEKELKLPKWGK